MKSNATQRTSVPNAEPTGNGTNHKARFVKVTDQRKHKIRGLWRRGSRYYAQMTVTDPTTGKTKVQRVPLVDAAGNPPASVPQALALMNTLVVQRSKSGLESHHRRAPKFADYVQKYLAAISAGEGAKKPRVIVGERAMLNIWQRHLGDLRLDQIRKVHVNDFATKRLAAGKAPRTVNLNVTILRNVLNRAVEDGLLPGNSLDGLRPQRVTRPERKLVAAEVIDHVCRTACGDPATGAAAATKNGAQFVDYLRFLQYTGAREKEALLVRWVDVSFDRGQLTIGAGGDTKNRTSRVVDLNPRLRAHLLSMCDRSAGVSQWLFPSPQRAEQDVPARSFRESLKLVRSAAGCPHLGFHDLRHHFISMAVMAGVDFMTIAKWVGHRDGGVLIGKVYGHLADEHRRQMASKLAF
jgi:integrase